MHRIKTFQARHAKILYDDVKLQARTSLSLNKLTDEELKLLDEYVIQQLKSQGK